MMKKLTALFLAMLMLLAATACGKQPATTSGLSSGESSAPSPDVNPEGNSDPTASGPEGSGTSDPASADNKTTTKNNTTKKVDTNTRTSLTWQQVKAQMPKNLKKTIVVYDWNPAGHTTGAPEALTKFKKETGITVKWVVGNYDDYITKLTAMVTSGAGKGPDAFRMRDPNVAMLKNAKSLDELNYNFNDSAWNDTLMNIYQVNGKRYGMIVKDTPYWLPEVQYYNKTLIAKYRLEDPYAVWKKGQWTFEKMKEICLTFMDKAENDRYFAWGLAEGNDYNRAQNATYIDYDPAKSQYVTHMDDARLVKGWQFTAEAVQDGWCSDTVWDVNGFNNGNLLFIDNSLICARTTNNYFTALKGNKSLGTVPMPTPEGVNPKDPYTVLSENQAYAVAKNAANPEAAPYFVRFFMDCANYDMDNFFVDAQAKEVFEWSRKRTKVTNMVMDVLVDKAQYGNSVHDMSYTLRRTEKGQIKATLDTYKAMIEKCAADKNAELKKLK